MLGLTLRDEFKGKRLKGTAIELANQNKTGATQVATAEFLGITYPTGDVLTALEAVGPDHGRPLTLIGERGQGKSHLMGVLHHALSNPAPTQVWLKAWGLRLKNPKVAELPLRAPMHVISESLHRQNYKFLWDLVFERHPHGTYIKGKWEGSGDKKTDIPGDKLLLELFSHTPTALILDEFQTWFDGLTNSKQAPWKTWAFNFIQILSEIAKEHPDKLVMVVSVRSGESEAYQQIHRVNPTQVDFKGPHARRDRLRLLQHRLFDNWHNVSEQQIEPFIANHVNEYLRLSDASSADHQKIRQEFIEAWPFSPNLIQILEDQVLVATQAQETRDLIRILADLFKRHAPQVPIITAADFLLEDDKSGIAALIDSVSNQHHANLREKAQRNLSAVRDAVKDPATAVPHLDEIVGALWVRSLAIKNAGAESHELQIDISRTKAIDDNLFQVELTTIVDNSFNIHQEGARYVFREEENPQAKLIANARNDKLFSDGADRLQLSREVRYVIGGGDSAAKIHRVLVLPSAWMTDPWSSMAVDEQPTHWDDRVPLLVLPEMPEKLSVALGGWLKERLQTRRNAVRFLLPKTGSTSLFYDKDLLILARAVMLADKWSAQGQKEYNKLKSKYEKELRDILKSRFDRFAILSTWNFQQPDKCTFHVEGHSAEGDKIPDAIDEMVRKNLFVDEDFNEVVVSSAANNESVGKLLRDMQEPRPASAECIPWLGETLMKEKLIRVCARGDVAINLRGMEYLQVKAGEDEETAWKRMRGKLGTGKHLDETYVLPPQAVPVADGVAPPIASPPVVDFFSPQPASPQEGAATPSAAPAAPVGGGLFVTGALKACVAPPTSALNLLGKLESWQINTGTQVRDVAIKVTQLTGAQLTELLKKLPDGVHYELSLNKEEK